MNYRGIFSILFCLFLCSCGENIKKKSFEEPPVKWAVFYEQALKENLFPNEKIWADATPKGVKEEVLSYYEVEKQKKIFSLKLFLDSTFVFNRNIEPKVDPSKVSFQKYLESTFLSLIKKASDDGGSQLPTRKTYISGGGIFQEFGYAQSYFVYKGLEAMGREDLCENLILNFLQFIQDYGHVPAANRTYKLQSSELPVLVLLIEEHCKKHPEKLAEYSSLLTKEYQYWIAAENSEEAKKQNDSKKTGMFRSVVFMRQNDILNRYYTADSSRRADSYLSDATFSKSVLVNLRTNDMAGYQVKGRWKAEETSQMLPLELNALLYKTEVLLGNAFELKKKSTYAESFKNLANKRKNIFNTTFWKNNFYFDYNFKQEKSSSTVSLAALWPLLVDLADKKQTETVLKTIASKLENQGLFQNSETDNTISIELNYLAYLAIQKAGDVVMAQKLKGNLLEFAKNNYEKNGELRATYGSSTKLERVDGALGALLAIRKGQD
jgi:alpha,alpha-trehalase